MEGIFIVKIYENLNLENLPNEIWKKCGECHINFYEVSNLGRIKAINKKTKNVFIKKQSINKHGRLVVSMGGNKLEYVYRLAAQAFIPNPENKPTVNHINIDNLSAEKNKLDNRIVNLEWATMAEQNEHAWEQGFHSSEKISIPAVVLNSNGELITSHFSLKEALNSCEGTERKFDENTQIKGNKIVTTKAHFESLSENEIFEMSTHCFNLMLKKMFVVDGQLFQGIENVAEFLNCSKINVHQQLRKKNPAKIMGKLVIRL